MVCYECIHCHLFIAVLLSILDTFCHAILRNCRIAIYILQMLSAEVNILHTGEASGHTMICISRLWDKRADIFHIEVYIPSEEAIFCCYCNLYFKCKPTFGVESWNSCYILKLHLPFKCEDYIWCISMQCLMHFVSVLDNHPLFEKLRLFFFKELSLKNQDVKHQCIFVWHWHFLHWSLYSKRKCFWKS